MALGTCILERFKQAYSTAKRHASGAFGAGACGFDLQVCLSCPLVY